jgi:hypothetical protein
MSVLRPKPPEDPISLLLGPLAAAASEPLARLSQLSWEHAAAGLRPEQLLDDYMRDRTSSELFRALATARELREAVDAVVVICDEPLGHGIQGLFETCCHPFHNALSRGERGGRPRLFFDVGPPDPDRTAGLLDLQAAARGNDLLDRWGVVRIVAREPAPRSAAPVEGLLRAGQLEDALGRPIAACPSLLLTAAAGPCGDVFTPALLITASLAGIDVVRFLSGGVAMLRRFVEASPESNPPLLLAAAMWAVAAAPQPGRLSLDTTLAPATTALARWWASDAEAESGLATPLQHSCLLTVRQPRRGSLPPPSPSPGCGDGEGSPLPSRLSIDLPRLDEHTVGQLLAMRLLALHVLALQAAAT